MQKKLIKFSLFSVTEKLRRNKVKHAEGLSDCGKRGLAEPMPKR